MERVFVLLSPQEFARVFGMRQRSKDPRLPSILLTPHQGGAPETYFVFKAEGTQDTLWHRVLRLQSYVDENQVEQLMGPEQHMHELQASKLAESVHTQALESSKISTLLQPQGLVAEGWLLGECKGGKAHQGCCQVWSPCVALPLLSR